MGHEGDCNVNCSWLILQRSQGPEQETWTSGNQKKIETIHTTAVTGMARILRRASKTLGHLLALSAGAVEYTDCFSAVG